MFKKIYIKVQGSATIITVKRPTPLLLYKKGKNKVLGNTHQSPVMLGRHVK